MQKDATAGEDRLLVDVIESHEPPEQPEPADARRAGRPTAQAWVCPFCETHNAYPERTTCAGCAASRDEDGMVSLAAG